MSTSFPRLTPDGRLLFASRIARMFGFGLISVVLVLYLTRLGFGTAQVGALLTLTLVGDTMISLWLTTTADRRGRKLTLLIGAGLMAIAGLVFATSDRFVILLIAATVGVISPSGGDVGPFLPVEHAALSETLPESADRTHAFAWYNLCGSFAVAFGALAAGGLSGGIQSLGYSELSSYRAVVVAYAAVGVLIGLAVSRLTRASEPSEAESEGDVKAKFGLRGSHGIVLRLSALFALDAFGGGFVMQSVIAYWFYARFGVSAQTIGGLLFGANLLAGVSSLSAAAIARRIGLIKTMVFTHLPSNVLLILVPFMPNVWLAGAVLLLRFSISQMDVPTRQAFTMAAVKPSERSAAGGITGVARSVGAAASPSLAGALLASSALFGAPFIVAGALKIVYDLLLLRSFGSVERDAEMAAR